MANPTSNPTQISLLFIITYLSICISGHPISLHFQNGLRNDSNAIKLGSNDYGNIFHKIPTGVLYPSSISDIIKLVKSSNTRSTPFTIAARGIGHSVRGQAMARGGVVVDMTALRRNGSGISIFGDKSSGFYADVGGEVMWIDVLRETMKKGLSPVSWTDYLYLTVGGTLSNAGVSGQTFRYGPQINNVHELDVITGKGEFVTCSRHRNRRLFFAVLGGLGQFGIITRARIVLDIAPTRAKWARLLYSDFSMFSRDQERLISSNEPNYIEGFLITNANNINGWRSTFSSPSNQSDVVSLLKKKGLIYAIELVKYYDNRTAKTINKEFEKLLKELNFNRKFIFHTDVPIFNFLARIPNRDNPNGPQQIDAHPWLHLFIPKSRIFDFNDGVIAKMLPKLNATSSSGVFLFYPLNKNKWNRRMSAVIPDEPIFYSLFLLHTSPHNGYQIIDNFNNQILEFCEKAGIKAKQYLPYYESKADWIKHYGSKWNKIQRRKALFDSKFILSPGQGIFNSA